MGNDSEVKVQATAVADTDALERMRDQLKKLRHEQREFEQMGAPKAASEVRRRADSLERRIDREGSRRLKVEDDEARATAKAAQAQARERASQEKLITRELKEQDALQKAGIRTTQRRVSQAYGVAQDLVHGGPAAATGGMMQAGMLSGHPGAMVATIAAALVGAIATTVAQERDKDTMQGLGVQQRAAMRAYRANRQTGIFGSSGGMVSDALSADEEIADRQSRRGEIAERARLKWYAPSTWTWGGLRKNEGQREEEVNEAEIEQLEKKRAQATAAARKKYMAEEGGLELRALRGRSQRTLEGSREAFRAELGQEWLGKYKEVMRASGDEGMAKEMADLTTQNKLRDMQAGAGAGLVDARSGGAGVAAAAAWSRQVFPDMISEMKALHATVQAQANPLEKQHK